MKSFQEEIQAKGIDYIKDLLYSYLIVFKKDMSSTLSFRRVDDRLVFYKGRDNEEITDINSALYTFFQEGVDYLKRNTLIFYREFPEGWLFRFQYTPQPSDPNLNPQPQHTSLCLSCIDTGNYIISDPDVLKKWADRMKIDYEKSIFQGFLSEFQKEKLLEYLNTGDCCDIPFTTYIISILDSSKQNTLNDNTQGFIFKFYKPASKTPTSLKLIDPIYSQLTSNNQFEDIGSSEEELLLINFILFVKSLDLNDITIKGDSEEERYFNFICTLFNKYIESEWKILKDIKTNKVTESLELNLNKIPNQKTIEILTDKPNLKKIFQIIIGNFIKSNNNKSSSSLITGDILDTLNKEIKDIQTLVSDKTENIKSFNELMNTEENKKEDKILTFEEFLKQNEKTESNTDGEPATDENEEAGKESKESEDNKSENTKAEDSKSDENKETGEEGEHGEPESDKKQEEEPGEEVEEDESDNEEEEETEEEEKEEKEESDEDKKSEKPSSDDDSITL